jgi:hypothetical protein
MDRAKVLESIEDVEEVRDVLLNEAICEDELYYSEMLEIAARCLREEFLNNISEEYLLAEAKKVLWDLKYGKVIRSDGLEEAVKRIDGFLEEEK